MFLKKLKSVTILFICWAMGLTMGCAEKKNMGLANPASQNCVEKRGTLKITKRGDGGEYGICIFTDNRQCEEWALFRGECPLGGVKITGFLTAEGIYCALKGGMVLENEVLCQLPSGKSCSTQDLYHGECS